MDEIEFTDNLIREIKDKKEFYGLSNKLVADLLQTYFEKNKFTYLKIQHASNKDKKIIIKDIRSILRLSHGRFSSSSKSRIKLLINGDIESLLSSHSSTRERKLIYPELRSIINSLNIKSILDIGCGLNPIALASKDYFYYYLDINEEELNLVKEYFNTKKIKGSSLFSDIREYNLSDLPKVDICIMFKLLDIIDSRKYLFSKELLEKINCKYFFISFATKTLSGKEMRQKRRVWFEKLLKELNLNYEFFLFPNELFYLIKNNKV